MKNTSTISNDSKSVLNTLELPVNNDEDNTNNNKHSVFKDSFFKELNKEADRTITTPEFG